MCRGVTAYWDQNSVLTLVWTARVHLHTVLLHRSRSAHWFSEEYSLLCIPLHRVKASTAECPVNLKVRILKYLQLALVNSMRFLACKHHKHILFSTKNHPFSKRCPPKHAVFRLYNMMLFFSLLCELWSHKWETLQVMGCNLLILILRQGVNTLCIKWPALWSQLKQFITEPGTLAAGGHPFLSVFKPQLQSQGSLLGGSSWAI